jgi:DOMON domain
MRWDHSVDLDENFRMLWKVKESDIIVELQVRTLGYVGFGFARSEYIYGADMVIGWVDKNTFFQVSRKILLLLWVTSERECKNYYLRPEKKL